MKKYIQPQTSILRMNTESMLAASFDVKIDNAGTVDQALSEGKDAWGSESWGAEDEE